MSYSVPSPLLIILSRYTLKKKSLSRILSFLLRFYLETSLIDKPSVVGFSILKKKKNRRQPIVNHALYMHILYTSQSVDHS